jgi:AcrR family transcriptional regulator
MSETTSRPRGRPRLFDEEAALDELTALFWEKGYSQTSMSDMVEASHVHKSSLYSTFGSKDQLFAKILRRYLANQMNTLAGMIEAAGPGVDGIHAFLEMLHGEITSGAFRNGCLMVNSSTELCGDAPGFDGFGAEYRNGMRTQLRVLVSNVGHDVDPELIDVRTQLLSTFLIGLNATTRGGANDAEIRRVIDAMHATVNTW